jgi:uncharacterized membrane protein YgdD (TMEM256/DUF423 family)
MKLHALLGAVGAMGVALGAFGAHALKDRVSANDLEIWKTAVFYLLIHTLSGLIWESRHPKKGIALCMLIGIGIFSGSLFALVLSQIRILGAITPVGGLFMIAGWLLAVRCELVKSNS